MSLSMGTCFDYNAALSCLHTHNFSGNAANPFLSNGYILRSVMTLYYEPLKNRLKFRHSKCKNQMFGLGQYIICCLGNPKLHSTHI